MKRRDFLVLAGAAAAFPPVAFAQQPQMKRLGFLVSMTQDDSQTKSRLDAFWAGAGKQGWTDKNLLVDYRWGADTAEAAATPAAELVALKPDLLFTGPSPPLTALARLTQTIPIVAVFVNGTTFRDILGIQNFGHPGGNITGFAQMPSSDVYGKSIDLLRELKPGVDRIAVIYNPEAAVGGEAGFLSGYVGLAAKQNLQVVPFAVRTPTDIADAVRSVATDPTLGLIVNGDAYMGSNRATAIEEVAKYRLPAVWSGNPTFAADGALIVYASDPIPQWRGGGEYAGLILNGAKAADLPIQVASPELTVNLKTAKALGITIPVSVVARANVLIE